MLAHAFRAMNTDLLLAAEGPLDELAEAFRAAEALVRAYEAQFTRFSADSELSALNRAAGGWFAASPEMLEVVGLAIEMYQTTGGLFNPAILADLERAGYDRSMDEIRAAGGRVPSAFHLPALRVDFSQVQINVRMGAIRLPPGLRIDLGGIAKGWIGQRAAEFLQQTAQAVMVDAGGDLYACGLPKGEIGWEVAVEDPYNPQRDAAVLKVGPGAVATSSTARRRWRQAGKACHHLIDPGTGRPADSQWVSVTAIVPRDAGGNQGARAEALAKAMLIAGPERADSLLQAHPGCDFVAIDHSGQVWRRQVGLQGNLNDPERKVSHESISISNVE